MKVITGVLFMICGAVMYLTFELFIVRPAMTRKPHGGFGELYGPVAFMRYPVYGVCLVSVMIGLIIVLAFL
jgi:hypothetical protein